MTMPEHLCGKSTNNEDIGAVFCAPHIMDLDESCAALLGGSNFRTCLSAGSYIDHLTKLGPRGLLVLWVSSVEAVDQPFTCMYALKILNQLRRKCAIVIVADLPVGTALGPSMEFLQAGALDVVVPSQADLWERLRAAVWEVKTSQQAGDESTRLADQFRRYGLVGTSPPFIGVLRVARQASRVSAPVLITGETGTGKQQIAEAIHQESDRFEQPCRTVNCGALPPNLIESELFGHIKGSFTGATKNRDGLFISAGQGTLILDEITELPYYLQCKLLRVLQEQVVAPVGADEEKTIQCRIIALTNVPAKRLRSSNGSRSPLRTDLYYRLNALSIHMPPLRKRLADVPLLAQCFLEKHRGQARGVVGFEPLALAVLQQLSWPGNIRQLENAVQEMLARTREKHKVLLLRDVPGRLLKHAT